MGTPTFRLGPDSLMSRFFGPGRVPIFSFLAGFIHIMFFWPMKGERLLVECCFFLV